MSKRNSIDEFSKCVWEDVQSSIERNIEYGTLDMDESYFVLAEENLNILDMLKKHMKMSEACIFKEGQAIGYLTRKNNNKDGIVKYYQNLEEVFTEKSFKGVIVIKPHVNSLDSLGLEVMVESYAEETMPIYIYAYETDELNHIKKIKRHISGLQLYWQLLEWFQNSNIKEEYVESISEEINE